MEPKESTKEEKNLNAIAIDSQQRGKRLRDSELVRYLLAS